MTPFDKTTCLAALAAPRQRTAAVTLVYFEASVDVEAFCIKNQHQVLDASKQTLLSYSNRPCSHVAGPLKFVKSQAQLSPAQFKNL